MTDELPPDLDVELPMPGGLKVTADRPYRILYVADLGGTDAGAVHGPLAGGVVPVDAESFNELLAQARPAVRYKATDPTLPGNALTEIELSFDSLKAFQPEALLARLEPAKPLVAARGHIVARLRGKKSADELAANVRGLVGQNPGLAWLTDALQWTPGTAPPPADDVLDDLLGQLDLGDGDAAGGPPRTSIGKAVAAAASGAGPQTPPEEAAALRRALAEIDRRQAAWLNGVLHAPAVQRLESVWRGLSFLVTHAEFRKGVRMSVLHAPRAELAARLVTCVIDPVFDANADAPDLIMCDVQFGNGAPDMEALDELAQHAASLPAVLLAGAAPEFLGVKHAWQVPTLPPIISLFDQWQFAKWKSLRLQPYARFLGLIFGRTLLREPHHVSPPDKLEFSYTEECIGESDFVWAGGAVPAAATVARSFAETRWPTGIVGRLDGFVTAQGGKKGEKQFGPADTQMPVEKAQELAAGGLNAVISIRNQPQALVCNGFSAAFPARAEGFALLEVSLPYQLFASRLSNLLLDLKPHLAGLEREKLVSFVLGHVRDWLTMEDVKPDDQQVAVQARPAEDNPAAIELAVTVTPPPKILPGGVPVVVGYKVS